MNLAQVAGCISGSCILCVAMSCSVSNHAPTSAHDAGFGILDATMSLLSPESEAAADPNTETIATEKCDSMVGGSAGAVHTYPGKTVNDLSHVIVTLHLVTPVGGYESEQGLAYIKTGEVGVSCSPTRYDSVTFILP